MERVILLPIEKPLRICEANRQFKDRVTAVLIIVPDPQYQAETTTGRYQRLPDE